MRGTIVKIFCVAAPLVLMVFTMSCDGNGGGSPSSVTPVSVSTLKSYHIKQMRMDTDVTERSTLETEVHLVDPISGSLIACAALESVDDKGELYQNLNAPLKQVWTSNSSPNGLVRVSIVERDSGACPEPASRGSNDYLAEKVIAFDELTAGPVTFDNGSQITFGSKS